MSHNSAWEQFFNEGVIDDIVGELQKASTLCDRQCFGMTRDEVTVQIRDRLAIANRKLEAVIKRLPPDNAVAVSRQQGQNVEAA